MSDVTRSDILRHYFASVIVYGLILLLVAFCPLYLKSLEASKLNYLTILTGYYVLYIIFALPIFSKFKPESIKNSRSVAILGYIRRQFGRLSPEERIKNLEMSDNEKQSFVIMFVKAFFGVYCLNLLCSKYFPSLDYDFAFLKEMFGQAYGYAHDQGFVAGIAQFIDDSSDMIINLIFFVTTIVFAISYLTEANFLKNKINYADTSLLGVFTCLICYYPFTIIIEKLVPVYSHNLIPAPFVKMRVLLHLLTVIFCFISMIAILRLGTKSGNLTNRGIVTGFPYNIVRHPDYGAQIASIILLSIPLYVLPELNFLGKVVYTFGTLVWIYVYYLRAVTEERNLLKDARYSKYMEKVKHRFIPWVF